MSRLGYTLAKKDIPRYMKEVYNNPNNLTLSSLNYKVESNYKVRLSFRDNVPKGNSPSRYLEPNNKRDWQHSGLRNQIHSHAAQHWRCQWQ